MSRSSFHKVWIASPFSTSGNISGMLMLRNRSNFSGPVNVLHLTFFDFLPIQSVYPRIPMDSTIHWKVLKCVKPSRFCTFVLLLTLSSCRRSSSVNQKLTTWRCCLFLSHHLSASPALSCPSGIRHQDSNQNTSVVAKKHYIYHKSFN